MEPNKFVKHLLEKDKSIIKPDEEEDDEVEPDDCLHKNEQETGASVIKIGGLLISSNDPNFNPNQLAGLALFLLKNKNVKKLLGIEDSNKNRRYLG